MVDLGSWARRHQSSVRWGSSNGLGTGTFRDSFGPAVNLCGSTLGFPWYAGKPRTALYAGVLSGSNLVDQCALQVAVPGPITTKSCRLHLSKSGFNAFNSRKAA